MWREIFKTSIKMVRVRYIQMSISRNPYRIGVPGKEILLKNLRAPSCWKRKNYCQLLRTKTFFFFGLQQERLLSKIADNFFHYCHLVDKGNYFRRRKGTYLVLPRDGSIQPTFQRALLKILNRILLLNRERSIPTEVDE